jgi:hypothetical protein
MLVMPQRMAIMSGVALPLSRGRRKALKPFISGWGLLLGGIL